MKQLQNNFTTPEQSKRLVELGLPADSADCYVHGKSNVIVLPYDFTYTEWIKLKHNEERESDFIPCWSVGRLIEILTICYTKLPFETEITSEYGGTESLVIDFNNLISEMDFSKLEEALR